MNYFLTALFFTTMVSTVTQAQKQKQIVTSKCGCTEIDTATKFVWKHTLDTTSDGITEILKSPDVNSWIVIDYKNKTVTTPFHVYRKVIMYSLSSQRANIIEYNGSRLKIYVDTNGDYKFHTVSELRSITDL